MLQKKNLLTLSVFSFFSLLQSYFLVRCWCKAKVQFKEHLFTQIIENMMHCIGNDIDTSVQVMANMALNYLLLYQLGPNRLSEGGTTQVQMDLIKGMLIY